MKRRTGGETKSTRPVACHRLHRLLRTEHGATAIEYAAILAIFALLATGAVMAVSMGTKSLHSALARDVAGTGIEFNKYSVRDATWEMTGRDKR